MINVYIVCELDNKSTNPSNNLTIKIIWNCQINIKRNEKRVYGMWFVEFINLK